nr:catalase [Bacteroidetes bacterium endosymbiont of Geopemphigus sp.]
MLTRVYSNYSIPANYRQMDGSSIHTFKWINYTGKVVYVKYTWKSLQGVKILLRQRSAKCRTKIFSMIQ